MADGKHFGLQDMVRVGCRGCEDCCECCRGMGDTVVADPYDVYRLSRGLRKTPAELLDFCLELHVEEGVILPNLRMDGEKNSCVFLNSGGRCQVHELRPGLCRTFPLGRDYEGGKLSYFLLEDACPKENKVKLKVEKWLDEPTLKQNQEFLVKWHFFVRDLKERFAAAAEGEPQDEGSADGEQKRLNMALLQTFYLAPYGGEDFYAEFTVRLERFSAECGL